MGLVDTNEAVEHFRRVIEATENNGAYNMGFVDGLEFCISHLSTMLPAQPEIKCIAKVTMTDGQVKEALEKAKGIVTVLPDWRKGKWIADAIADNIYHCSECGADAPVNPTGGTEYKSNYCPNCGADMRDNKKEE